jgi:inosine-uridine nucleoside N-ribohydrolase
MAIRLAQAIPLGHGLVGPRLRRRPRRALGGQHLAGLSTQLGTIVQSGVNGYYFRDPLAALALVDTGSIVQTQPVQLQVQTQLDEESDTSGSLIQGSGATIDVALSADASLARSTFLSTITGVSQDQAAAYLSWSSRGQTCKAR